MLPRGIWGQAFSQQLDTRRGERFFGAAKTLTFSGGRKEEKRAGPSEVGQKASL